MYAGCSVLAAIVLLMGSRGLETAVANGDTRTISLHHIHTNEDITITFKRDGRYDEEALKKLNWFVRDWRKEEEHDMDPRLFDLVWEASREVGGGKVIHVVCGYRSPATNAMLRARSSGVAKFSQHTLGKAMDFFIPGASLEELRNVGLRLQRGGVGYYPTSGSPFVHLDVGNVRHWGPAIGEAEMAKIMSGGHTHVAALSDGAKRATPPKKSIPVVAHGEDDDEVAAKPAPVRSAAAPARANTFTVASLESKPAELPRPATVATVPALPVPQDRPAKTAMTTMDGGARAAFAKPAAAASTVAWPVRDGDNDRTSTDLTLAYATQPPAGAGSAMRPEPMAAPTAKAAAPRDSAPHDNVTTVVKKMVVRTASLDPAGPHIETRAAEPIAAPTGTTVTAKTVSANAGMRYDDPWLRAMILAPNLTDSMTATLYGTPDLTELRNLMRKPASSLMLVFNDAPYSTPNHFSGEAVVFLTTRAFTQRTAALR
jgi:uncharacterized protein YcbK (DUF882 family)